MPFIQFFLYIPYELYILRSMLLNFANIKTGGSAFVIRPVKRTVYFDAEQRIKA